MTTRSVKIMLLGLLIFLFGLALPGITSGLRIPPFYIAAIGNDVINILHSIIALIGIVVGCFGFITRDK